MTNTLTAGVEMELLWCMTTPLITPDNVRHINSIAYRLSRDNYLGVIATYDELRSQGGVILWDLALTFDPGVGTFRGYINSLARLRMIDWMRSAYGRIDDTGTPSHKMIAMHSDGNSLDGELLHLDPADKAHSVEELVLSAERMAEVMLIIDRVCTPLQKEALLWGVTTGRTNRALAESHGVTEGATSLHLKHAKARVLDAIKQWESA